MWGDLFIGVRTFHGEDDGEWHGWRCWWLIVLSVDVQEPPSLTMWMWPCAPLSEPM
jgi:hypothetical protein